MMRTVIIVIFYVLIKMFLCPNMDILCPNKDVYCMAVVCRPFVLLIRIISCSMLMFNAKFIYLRFMI